MSLSSQKKSPNLSSKKYYINQFQEDIFNIQLPYQSIKILFKPQRQQKFLKINQKKLQIEILREAIYHKCKQKQLDFIQQLSKQRQRIWLKKQEEKRKRGKEEEMEEIRKIEKKIGRNHQNGKRETGVKNKEENKNEKINTYKNSTFNNRNRYRDSVDDVIQQNSIQTYKKSQNVFNPESSKDLYNRINQKENSKNFSSNGLYFSLQPNFKKKVQQKQQQIWIKKVIQQRQIKRKLIQLRQRKIRQKKQNSSSQSDTEG